MVYRHVLSALWIALSLLTRAAIAAPEYQVGKDYQKIAVPLTSHLVSAQGKIKVIEFFSYGCPWCYELEAKLPKWQRSQASDVVFQRVPVLFEKSLGYIR